jgi:phosphorylase/glycogen(starch) synthase
MKPDYIFETSWEICNKIGGIYTVIATKTPEMKRIYGDRYLLIGPDVWKGTQANPDFIEDHTLMKEWREASMAQGLKFRIGRWNIPEQPIAILVDYTQLFPQKDKIFAHLWEEYKLDSLSGHWDYIEPAMFGYAAGQVIESFHHFFLTPADNVMAQFHEWMTGTGILYLKEKLPVAGCSFTTHATVLGRSIAGNGLPLYEKMGLYTPSVMAQQFNVISKHSLESLSARYADVFTTVSAITSNECEHFLGKKADFLTINGIAKDMIPEAKGLKARRKKARKKALEVAGSLNGTSYAEDTLMVLNSGRYEFKNKGIDIFIEALGKLNQSSDKSKILAFIAVPAAHEGPQEFFKNQHGKADNRFVTHNLSYPDGDPVLNALTEHGIQNQPDDRVHVVFVPAYLDGNDGVFQLNYYDFLTAFDYTVFPSYYEPWGYTPLESLSFGIPSLTTTYAGFGSWIQKHCTPKTPAITVVDRHNKTSNQTAEEIAHQLEKYRTFNEQSLAAKEAKKMANQLVWNKLIVNYQKAWSKALEQAEQRKNSFSEQWTRPDTMRLETVSGENHPQWKKILVRPVLPEALKPLKTIAFNLWWSWNSDAISLFKSIYPEKWEKLDHNPVRILESLSLDRINQLTKDNEFLKSLNAVYTRFEDYMNQKPLKEDQKVAYFSMEYGLHNSVKIFSGGLGMLAGDYLKQASDSNKNMLAVGLLYRYGYFRQVLNHFGDQQAEYNIQKSTQLPLVPVRDNEGHRVRIAIALPGRIVWAKAWKLEVGRVPLYLLDTDVSENSEEDKKLTAQLYGGDNEHRLKQEMLLGLGGIRLLNELGLKPDIFHSNEGHSAFIGLERIKKLIEDESLDFETAREFVRGTNLFTTHTPVPAGHDTFEEHLMRAYLSHFSEIFNISWDEFMALGRFDASNKQEKFSMSVLAARLSQEINGVSKIHGRVSREMFRALYPGYYPEELHIGYVTNGVHYFTWTDKRWQHLYRESFDTSFESNQHQAELWEKIYDLPDAKLWETRKAVKKQLIGFVKQHIQHDLTQRQESPRLILDSVKHLNENTMLFGFARRFATYKRAHLLFTNPERLAAIVNNPEKPVVFLFAGKAHPHDKAGQDLIKKIIEYSKMPQFIGRIIFLENYDMIMGKMLTNGVDVWLNTPTRPLEASGTSGEKAIMNGVLNFSVLDGWWAEGYRQGAGWAIPETRTYHDQHLQDELDAEMIYKTLETEIIPTYFNQNKQGISAQWMSHVKNTIAQIAPHFTMQRMLNDYYQQFYKPLFDNTTKLKENHFEAATKLAQWKQKLNKAWPDIKVESILVPDTTQGAMPYGKHFIAEIVLDIAHLQPEDLGAEVIMGNKTNGDIEKIVFSQPMNGQLIDGGKMRFVCDFPLTHAGIIDYAFRLFPKHKLLRHRMDFPLVKWI